MDPITTIGTISAGLNLIDQFRKLALKFMNKKGGEPSVHAEAKNDTLEIERDGVVVEKITATQIKMNEWDEKRYETLEKKIRINWNIFNDIDGEYPTASTDEKARLKAKMDSIKSELCADFREMLTIYEKTIGTRLGDHYSLYSVCGMT